MELANATPETPVESTEHVALAVALAIGDRMTDDPDEPLQATFAGADERAALKAVAKVAALGQEAIAGCNATRVARLWVVALGGAKAADLRFAVGAAKSGVEHVEVTTRYAGLSRGKCWGRSAEGAWADKEGSAVYLTSGRWTVGSDDGFRRKEKTSWVVRQVGPYLFGA